MPEKEKHQSHILFLVGLQTRRIYFRLILTIATIVGITILFVGGLYSNSFAQEQENQQQLQEPYYSYLFKFGSNGTGDGQFMRPHDVAFDSKGNVYISDRELNNIQKFDSNGTFIMKWGSEGEDEGQFDQPYSLVINPPSDEIYVIDRGNDRIQEFDTEGNFIQQWNKTGVPGGGDEEGVFRLPEDMAIDARSGHIYLADTRNQRVIKFDKDFNYILEWGTPEGEESTKEGEFTHPHGIDVDSKGNVYVNELAEEPPTIPRIQKFDSDGNFLMQWGSAGTGEGEFTYGLEHLDVDSKDRVYMVNGLDDSEIEVFDDNGTFITKIGDGRCEIETAILNDKVRMAQPHPCDGKFDSPEHLNIDDSNGNVWVVDKGNRRIEVFATVK